MKTTTNHEARIPTSGKLLCAVYLAVAIAGLIATWSQAHVYFNGTSGLLPALGSLLNDSKVTPAARTNQSDMMFFYLAAAIFMVVEARRHGMRFVWAYIVSGPVIGICVTFSLFLLARELRLNSSAQPKLTTTDTVLLSLFAIVVAGIVIWVDLV
jgi:Terpene cyclase DEP1